MYMYYNNSILHTIYYLLFLKWTSEVAQSCVTLCDPVDCSLPSSPIHGILQARILEWVAISFSRGSSLPRDRTRVSYTGGRRFNFWASREAQDLIKYSYKMIDRLYKICIANFRETVVLFVLSSFSINNLCFAIFCRNFCYLMRRHSATLSCHQMVEQLWMCRHLQLFGKR